MLAQRLDLPAQAGVYVTRVLVDSPARQAGLIPSGTLGPDLLAAGGDIIIAVDGVPVDSVAEFFAELDRYGAGDPVTFNVVRRGGGVEVAVTLGEWPAEGNPFINSPTQSLEGPKQAVKPRYPLVPHVPGFPFPDLFPRDLDR